MTTQLRRLYKTQIIGNVTDFVLRNWHFKKSNMMSCRLGGIANRLNTFKFKRIILELAKFLHLLYSYKHYFPRWRVQNTVNVKDFQSTQSRSQCPHGLRRGSEQNNFKSIWWKLYTIFEQLLCTVIFELVHKWPNYHGIY